MLRFYSISSCSRANAVLVSSEKTNILIDCGLSGKKLSQALDLIDMHMEDIDAILVTHEHSDHIAGVGVAARMAKAKVYANGPTWEVMESTLGTLPEENKLVFDSGRTFEIGDIAVSGFRTPHDAAASVGYTLAAGGKKVAVATDMGHITDNARAALLGCDAVMLESNHDIKMLQNGTYPASLKRRILSEYGHLSNPDCAAFAVELVKNGTTSITLSHLSEENNLPAIAYKETCLALQQAGVDVEKDLRLSVARCMSLKQIL